jgi:hypothetical protein
MTSFCVHRFAVDMGRRHHSVFVVYQCLCHFLALMLLHCMASDVAVADTDIHLDALVDSMYINNNYSSLC